MKMTKRQGVTPRSSRFKNTMQFIKFTLFSATAGIIQVASFSLLNELAHLPYWPAYLIALILSVVYNFTINRRLTFRSTTHYSRAMLKVFGYYLVFTPLSTWWGDRLTTIGWNEYIVLIGTMLINFITEYLFSRYVVFRGSIDSIDNTDSIDTAANVTGTSNPNIVS
ncbi:MAG: GtrA family protein [Eubacteriales bacterium]|nr:GtrA family protein [Eubacteriales bacterium]